MSSVRPTVHVLNFSHLDLSWLGTQEECLSRAGRILAEVIRRARASTGYRFHIEYVSFVAHYLERHPEALRELRALVSAGQIEVGAQWIGIHTAYQPGEHWVRNVLYAQRWLRSRLGQMGRALMLTDLPDHSPQLPQVLIRSGVNFLVLTRMGPRGHRLFRWQSLDGSAVLTWSDNPRWNAYGGYGWSLYRGLAESWPVMERLGFAPELGEELTRCPVPHYLLHAGNDLVRPFPALESNLETLSAQTPWTFRLSTLGEFYDAVAGAAVPTLRGEVPCAWAFLEARYAEHFVWEQTASARLIAGEVLASLASALGRRPYPARLLTETWQTLLAAEDHNYGCQGARDGDALKLEGRQIAEQVGRRVGRAALAVLAENVSTHRTRSVPILVFNPLPWTRTGLATGHFTFYWAGLRRVWDLDDAWPEVTVDPALGTFDPIQFAKRTDWKAVSFTIIDDTGQPAPFQILSDNLCETRDVDLLLDARDIPGCGYRTYYIVPGTPLDRPRPSIVADTSRVTVTTPSCRLTVDLARHRIQIDNNRGSAQCCLKVIGEAIPSDNQAEDTPDGRTWDLELDKAQVLEHGPLRTRIWVTGSCAGISALQVKLELAVYTDAPWIDLEIEITSDVQVPARIEMACSATGIGEDVWYGIPLGANALHNIMEGTGPEDEDAPPRLNRASWTRTRIVQRWVNTGGLAVLSNRHLFRFDPQEIRVVLCRLRTPLAGLRSRFRIWPHGDDWRTVDVPRAADEFIVPMETYTVNDCLSEKALPERESFISIDAPAVLLSAFKQAEDGQAFILRLYETTGRRQPLGLRIHLPIRRIYRCTLLEEAIEDVDAATLTIGPFEILTLRLEMEEGWIFAAESRL
ncbi:MAG: glycosyl hydrolase-related protein [Armatimonadota bacterium]|nr:glycosyl hydrolase-related protein [Armatimonadota bacterium]MDR7500391.1 glycosyl hydrolase-related protein [Armatimonadota bacterium]MDR7548045.1 glycosyl hydrolase-related protein [Armatimonadota bacterium]